METRYDEANKVTLQAIGWNIFLAFIKIIAGILGKSSVMIADGLHSASDIITSMGVLIGNYISSKPFDKEHNYGHEKAETLVSFLLSIILVGVALSIGYEASKSLFNIEGIAIPTLLPLVVSIISILIKEYQYRITIRIAKKINSPALKADFVGIGGAMLGFKILEPLASIVVALFVCKVGYDILKNAVNELMDVSIDETYENEIKKIAQLTEGVMNLGSLRTRKHGASAYVDLVICVDGKLTVTSGHDIATNLEKKIQNDINIVKGITVHVEPCNSCNEKRCNK